MDETMHWKMKWKDEGKSDIMKKLARSRTVDGVFYWSQYEGVGLDTYDELLGSPPTHESWSDVQGPPEPWGRRAERNAWERRDNVISNWREKKKRRRSATLSALI
jgi:hypothetical protein